MASTGIQALLTLAVEVAGSAAKVPSEIRRLIGEMSLAKYMAWRRRPPSQDWKTFLRNHADGIAAIDLFVVSTDSFRCSSAF